MTTKLRTQMNNLLAELNQVAALLSKPICLMEVCGTHTVSACRSGLHSLIPDRIKLVSGPGCPVCVTAQRYIDALIKLGSQPNVIIATYGDMLRVTGDGSSLELARSEGADVRVVNSTMEAVEIAIQHPERQVVFAAVGFETTAPATAAAVLAACSRKVTNFTILPCHKLVMPALEALLADPDICIDGFLCPGHVSVIIGADAYLPIVKNYGKPCAVAGFEPLQIMLGILNLSSQILNNDAALVNLYPQAVSSKGNPKALDLINQVFVPGDSAWRALGIIPDSGLELKNNYGEYDALRRFNMVLGEDNEPPGCRCGEVITGKCEPGDCKLFGNVCTPINPIGPCMVSSEGSCQAWFKYRRYEWKQHGKYTNNDVTIKHNDPENIDNNITTPSPSMVSECCSNTITKIQG